MPDSAVKYLTKLKAEQDKRKEKNRLYNHKWDDFVCVKSNGDLLPLEYVSSYTYIYCRLKKTYTS